MSAINNAWNRTTSTATEEMIKQQYQQAIGGGGGSGTAISVNIPHRPDRWDAEGNRIRFTVTKASNGYILETGDDVYIADTVEHVQGIVATLLIAKAE